MWRGCRKTTERSPVRLQILSDIHGEFGQFKPPPTDADVVVVAGDIHVGRNGRTWLRSNFPVQPLIYVLGNHEFYRHALPKLTEDLQRETEGSHIHLLENQAVEIGGYTFLGCTLWTDFQVAGNSTEVRLAAEQTMSDYQLIRVSPQFRKLRASDTVNLHRESVRWLQTELSRRDASKIIVVTHHAPSRRSVPPYHVGSILNGAFVSDLDDLVASSGVPMWIHGHTHHCIDYVIGKTRVLSNQRGYPDAVAPGFNPALVIEL